MFFLRMGFGASVAIVAMACTATTSGTGVDMPSEDVSSAPACSVGAFQISGVVDSVDDTRTAPVGNYGIANVGNPTTLSVEFGLGGSLELQWAGTLADGSTAPARGTLTLPASNGSPPEVLCVGEGSEVELLSWGGKFLLAGLHHATSSGACTSTAPLSSASGALLGCYGLKAQ